MNYIFIVNPTSGDSKGLEAGKIIEAYCKEKRINYKVVYTSKEKEAINLTSKYKNMPNTIIYSVGGDGTLNEVVTGLVGGSAKLDVIPVGSGNDFYKSLKNIDNNKIDLGKVNDRYFINIASFGIDAITAAKAEELKSTNLDNSKIYTKALLSSFLTFKPINLNINGVNKKVTILTICNGGYYGGGFNIYPNYNLNDGMFDICEVDSVSKIRLLYLLSKLVKFRHVGRKEFQVYKDNNIHISSNNKLCCNIDGEIITGNDFNISLINGAITLNREDNIKIIDVLKTKKLIK